MPGRNTPQAVGLSLAAALILALFAGCADPSRVGVESPDAEYWKGYVYDSGDMLSRPVRWETRDWVAFAMLTGATTAIYWRDDEIRDSVLDSHSSATESLAGVGEFTGRWEIWLPGFAAGWGLGYAFDDAKLKEASLLGFEGVIVSALATRVLKYTFGRARPYNDLGPGEFIGFTTDEDYTSFPSGHTTVAFAVATAFHLEYRNPWVSALAYSLAAIGGWSRIHDDVHWASDVFAGAVVGTVVTSGIYRARGERRGKDERSPSVQAFVTPGGVGAVLRF